MYSTRQNLVLGFHGCDKEVAFRVLNHKEEFQKSKNTYDWLGHGFYFWENNYQRAQDFAIESTSVTKQTKGKISEPFVLGAVIDLGYCLDLLESKSLGILKEGYSVLKDICEKAKYDLPINKNPDGSDRKDRVVRSLDCAVIETIHKLNTQKEERQFDSVRAPFLEGDYVYPGAGFQERNHIQLCIRNFNCIKGFFLPRDFKPDGFLHLTMEEDGKTPKS